MPFQLPNLDLGHPVVANDVHDFYVKSVQILNSGANLSSLDCAGDERNCASSYFSFQR